VSEAKLAKTAVKSVDSEFYSPIPKGYVKGKYKFIAITGSVISGIGKGTFTSSLAKILKERGLKVAPIKIEAYFNVDSGTLNPFRHGEVFVLDDGTETDLDLGTYERFLDTNLSKDNFITSGRIYSEIIRKERLGEFLGRDVQFIPHVTGETKLFFRQTAVKSNADIVLIEVGGTVGDFENMYILEALRQLAFEEGKNNVCIVNLTYILEPSSLGEQKSKAAQLGIKKLIEMGLIPDIIICRSNKPLRKNVREKIALFSNVPIERVIGLETMKDFYRIPLTLMEKKVDLEVLKVLNIDVKKLKDNFLSLKEWTNKMTVNNPKKTITIGIAGKYTGLKDAYISILKALEHCEAEFNIKINVKWIETSELMNSTDVKKILSDVNGVIVPGGFGKRGVEGKILVIQHCREKNIPFLGICYGMQLALIEFARNVLNLKNASSTEFEKNPEFKIIDILPEQKRIEGLGGNMRLGGRNILLKKDSLAFKLYGKNIIRERFRHRYEFNPEFIELFEKNGIVFSGKAEKVPIMQIMELPKNKFFLGVQFHPEFTSRPLKPNPCFKGLIKAIIS
jgi:CTP synthase